MSDLPANVFVDSKQRRWALAIDIGLARRVKAKTGIDLFKPGDDESIKKLLVDDEAFVETLWTLLAADAAAVNVDRDAFESGLDRETLEAALLALVEALVNFTRPELRPALRKLLATVDAAKEKAGRLAEEKIGGEKFLQAQETALAKLSAEMDADIDRLIGGKSPAAGPRS